MPDRQLMLDFESKPEQLLSPDEIFEQADEHLLQRLAEDRRIERKPATFSARNLGQYICMWANTAPDGGLIVLGMADKGAFDGCRTLSVKQVNSIDKSAHDYCPEAMIATKRVPVRNREGQDDFVILMRVKYHAILFCELPRARRLFEKAIASAN